MNNVTDEDAILPSSAGFHCDGGCWQDHGATEGLFNWLKSIDETHSNWFAYGDWAVEANLRHWQLPAMDDVHPIQDFLMPHTVELYKRRGYNFEKRGQKSFERYPTLFRWHGKFFIFQGTHRLAARFATEPTTFFGWFLDLDSLAA